MPPSADYSARAHALVTLLTYCGLRVSEALGADVAAIGEQSGHRVRRVVDKGDRPRTVELPAPRVMSCPPYVGDRAAGPIFIIASGKRWARHAAYETVHAIGPAPGWTDLHPHLLRHSAATAALDARSTPGPGASPPGPPRAPR